MGDKSCSMTNSRIGGQAVMEGVMMRNKNQYSVSVRMPDKTINTEVWECHSVIEKHKWLGLPFIRGTVSLIESTVIGLRSMTWSANFIEEEEEAGNKSGDNEENKETKNADDNAAEKVNDNNEKQEGWMSGWVLAVTMLISFGMAMLLFVFVPQLVADGFCKLTGFEVGGKAGAVVEGIMRLVIFIVYILLISLMEDIKRVFMYHGAEHKCINCVEHGMPLTVENVRKSSRFHKRCGTSFIIFVLVIAVILLMFIPRITAFHPIVNFLLRFLIRLALLPVIAGISYEFLRLAGSSENKIINALSKPGFWMQKLTTREPEDDMIEVGIASVEAVFDWKAFLKENFGAVTEEE